MKNRKLIRLLALILVLAITAGSLLSAGAANYVSDVNGDGKITVFDAQMIAESNAGKRTLSDTQKAAANGISIQDIMNYVLGDNKIDAGDTDGNGVFEIYSVEGLQVLRDQPAGSYILMNDLDLGGADWMPVQNFSGVLNGNGKTLSNFTINHSAADSKGSAIFNQGFFGDTAHDAVISDLHLNNVTLNAAADANSIGFFAGTLRGHLTGCTVVGTLNDTRETYSSDVYTGIMAGRLDTNSNCSIVGGTSLSYADELGKYTTEKLCANVKLFLANKDVNKLDNTYNKVGLAGYAPTSCTVTGQFVDTTYSSSLLSETIQARQKKVVDYMNAMGTVKWTPAEDWTYTAANGTDQTYKAGTVYTGLPYNGHNGSLERFLSVMGSQDENGVYTSVTGLGANCGYLPTGEVDANGNPISDWTDYGFYQIMGNDCSGAVNWAWMQVSNVLVEDVPSHGTPYKGGVYVVTTSLMIPNDANRIAKGIYQVGSWETSFTNDAGKWVSAEFDATKAAYQCTTETYSPEVLISNGLDTILEAYAQTHKADGVVCYVSRWSNKVANGGHARLVAADPVVIRNADGSIDPNASYMLLTEQGVGFTEDSTSRWNIEKKHTFTKLAGDANENTATTATKTYLPITIRALREDKIRDTYIVCEPANSIINPVSGSVYSYHHINSVTVTVTNAAGKVFYNHEAFTGISNNYNIYRGRNHHVQMADLHAETFYEAAAANGMVDGKAYYFTVDVLLSTGELIHLIPKKAFTYTAPAV